MAKITLGFAAALTIIPLATWLAAGMPGFGPLIPAAFGLLLGVCGLVGLNPARRGHAMHAAAAIALLSLLGLIGEVTLREAALDVPMRTNVLKLFSGVLLLAYLILSVRSFIAARRARLAGGAEPGRSVSTM